jgi:hypothetical protein
MNSEFATEANRKYGGIRLCTHQILYLRTLKALDAKSIPSFSLFPAPWGILADMMATYPKLFDVFDANILLEIEGTILTQEAFTLTLKTSQEYLTKIDIRK